MSVSGKRRRRTPQEVAHLQYVMNGLRVLGLAVKLTQPSTSKVFSFAAAIATSILQLIFPAGEPIHAMQEIVWNERALQQKMKMIGVKQVLRSIESYSGNNTALSDDRMTNLLDMLSYDKCLFMHRDGIRSSAGYFKEFATIHLAVIYASMNIHPNDFEHWEETLKSNLDDFIYYGKFVIQELNRVGRDGNALLEDAIEKWMSPRYASDGDRFLFKLDKKHTISSGQYTSHSN